MKDRELKPLQRLEEQTVNQTDFSAYIRFLIQEGVPVLKSMENLSEPPIERESRMILLIGFTTARVLENRKRAGLSNDAKQLWTDPAIKSWFQEFVVDEELKVQIGKGIVQGFEAEGLIPRGWQEFMPGSEIR